MNSADYFVRLYQRLTTASSAAPCPEDVVELDSFDPDSQHTPRRVTLTAPPLERAESPTTLSASPREDKRALTQELAQGGAQDSRELITSSAGEERSYLTFLDEVQARDASKARQGQADTHKGDTHQGDTKSPPKGSKKRTRSSKNPKEGALPKAERKSSKHKDQAHQKQPETPHATAPKAPDIETGDTRAQKTSARSAKGQRRRRSRLKGKERGE